MDGFAEADCQCEHGTTELTLSREVRAGQELRVAAIPAHWEDARELSGDLSLTFSPGELYDAWKGLPHPDRPWYAAARLTPPGRPRPMGSWPSRV